jgi:hypothetical protein
MKTSMVKSSSRRKVGNTSSSSLPADPYPFNPNPWLNVVVQLASAAGGTVTAANILQSLQAQVFPACTLEDIQLRIHKICVWETTGGSVELVSLSTVAGLGQKENVEINTSRDTAGRNKWAKVCYQYPAYMRVPVEPGTPIRNICRITSSATTPSFVAYFHVSFRTAFNDV